MWEKNGLIEQKFEEFQSFKRLFVANLLEDARTIKFCCSFENHFENWQHETNKSWLNFQAKLTLSEPIRGVLGPPGEQNYSARHIRIQKKIFNSRRQPLNSYYLGALLFFVSKRRIGGASFLIEIFLKCILNSM